MGILSKSRNAHDPDEGKQVDAGESVDVGESPADDGGFSSGDVPTAPAGLGEDEAEGTEETAVADDVGGFDGTSSDSGESGDSDEGVANAVSGTDKDHDDGEVRAGAAKLAVATDADDRAKRGKHAAPAETGRLLQVVAPIGGEQDTTFVSAGFGEIPTKKRHRGLKAFGITVGALAIALLVAYVVGVAVFMGHMLPNTRIGDHDMSFKSDQEVSEILDGLVESYQLDVIGNGFAYRTTGAGIGLTIDAEDIVGNIHEDLSPWRWPFLVLQPDHDETGFMFVSFNREAYEPDVIEALDKYNEAATPPVNATIAYDENTDKFVVKPEEAGTQLNLEAVLETMSRAIVELDPKVELTESELVEPTVFSSDEKLIEAAELATGMVSANLSLNMGGQPVGEVDGDTLSAFITIDENYEVVFREDEMNAWVDSLASSYNTVGTERTYTRADGKQISVPRGGVYGWEIDTEALKEAVVEGIKAGKTAQIDVPCTETAAVYNGVGQRDWGNRYIDVDIAEQHVRFYGDDGALIWEADCISGSPDGTHDTVVGTWYVNSKESPSKLIGYENGKKIYETSVTYWMPFEGNSIGFHDATWQPSFGGSMYANGYGSHGCVNLSYDVARSLYDIIQVGDVVVVHH